MTEQIVLNALNLVDAAGKEAIWDQVTALDEEGNREEARTLIQAEPTINALINLVVESEENDDVLFAIADTIGDEVEGNFRRFADPSTQKRLTLLLEALLLSQRIGFQVLHLISMVNHSDLLNTLLTTQNDLYSKVRMKVFEKNMNHYEMAEFIKNKFNLNIIDIGFSDNYYFFFEVSDSDLFVSLDKSNGDIYWGDGRKIGNINV